MRNIGGLTAEVWSLAVGSTGGGRWEGNTAETKKDYLDNILSNNSLYGFGRFCGTMAARVVRRWWGRTRYSQV